MNEFDRNQWYLLGWIASFCFFLRMLWQWLASERLQKSYVDAHFWHLSLLGNTLLATHYLIQSHLLGYLAQVISAALAYRNLALLHNEKGWPAAARIKYLIITLFLGSACFVFFPWTPPFSWQWLRAPYPGDVEISRLWHLVGLLGTLLFSTRFWLQWWLSEEQGRSVLNPLFWELSLTGGALMGLYAYILGDRIGMTSATLSLLFYLRNLTLMQPKVSQQRRTDVS